MQGRHRRSPHGREALRHLAILDGAVVMKNLDQTCIAVLSSKKETLEKELNVRLSFDAKSCQIFSKDGNHDKALDAKEKLEEQLEDLTAVETIQVPVPANLVNQVLNETALQQLKEQTGLTAGVYKNDKGTGIRMTGSQGSLQEAKTLIELRSKGQGAEFLSLVAGLLKKLPGPKKADFLKDVEFLQQNSGCEVDIVEDKNRINFTGPVG